MCIWTRVADLVAIRRPRIAGFCLGCSSGSGVVVQRWPGPGAGAPVNKPNWRDWLVVAIIDAPVAWGRVDLSRSARYTTMLGAWVGAVCAMIQASPIVGGPRHKRRISGCWTERVTACPFTSRIRVDFITVSDPDNWSGEYNMVLNLPPACPRENACDIFLLMGRWILRQATPRTTSTT